jgi:cysteinyl-tRNA synthetase
MAMKHLGSNIDLHCGGVDLIFPHHENEIAQSEAATGEPFVRFWIHCGFLQVEGEKMAKSAGNFYRLGDLLEQGFAPQAIRYLLVSVPYRKQFNLTFDGLRQAEQSLGRIRDFLFRLGKTPLGEGSTPEAAEALRTAYQDFEAGMDDDLNTAVALAALFNLIKAVNTALDEGRVLAGDRSRILEFMRLVHERLGIVADPEAAPSAGNGAGGARQVEELLAAREEARAHRDFGRADEIRRQLAEMGVLIEDTREGTRWRYE